MTYPEARIVFVEDNLALTTHTGANGVQIKGQVCVDKEETYLELFGRRRSGIRLEEEIPRGLLNN